MAGPAIRAWHIAIALSREHDVELATTGSCSLSHPAFGVRSVDGDELADLVGWCDILVFQGNLMRLYPVLRETSKVVVADIYDPFHLEVLEYTRGQDAAYRQFALSSSTAVLNEQLMRGDFFLCASQKQRDFWLGQLAAVGRINPVTYDAGENLESLITVVPFGVDDEAPVHTRSVLRGVVPGIRPDDRVILWGGGIYNWFDPLTLLRAVDGLTRRLPDVRLYFLGLAHPNPDVGEMKMAADTLALSDALGLTGTTVFFNDGWVDYDDRANFLLEADVGVSTHLDHVETAFSFRTRILDYLWAGLPVVATRGDALADLIEGEGVGLTVPPGDVDALEDALFKLLNDAALAAASRERLPRVAAAYRWSRVLQPLLDFCGAPRRAPDLLDPVTARTIRDPLPIADSAQPGALRNLQPTLAHITERRVRPFVAKARRRIAELRRRT
ncbi:MAG: glycosyltransferase family 4 protein [Acidimicrobiia bacterium]